MQLRAIPYKIEANAFSATEALSGAGMINVNALWSQDEKGKGTIVAIIDSGCDTQHADLQGQIIDGANFTTEGSITDVHDGLGHGTHVAGIIAAKEDGQGVVGVAPEAKLLILKALDSNGSGSFTNVIYAISYAIDWRGPNDEKVNVINMSLGGPMNVPALHDVIKRAVQNGILVVCAAGNEGDGKADTNEYSYPGCYDEVVSVGAITQFADIPYFQNSNEQIDLVAPGYAIKSTYPGGYASMTGTSMAAPHVAGAAVLLYNQFKKNFGRVPSEAELYGQVIKSTVSNDLPQQDKRLIGNGRLCLKADIQKPDSVEISIEDAINGLVAVGVIQSPEFWLNLVNLFNSQPEQYKQFRYVDLLIRNMYRYTM